MKPLIGGFPMRYLSIIRREAIRPNKGMMRSHLAKMISMRSDLNPILEIISIDVDPTKRKTTMENKKEIRSMTVGDLNDLR